VAYCKDVRLNYTQGQSCSWIVRLFAFYDVNALAIIQRDCLQCRVGIHLHLFLRLSNAFLKCSRDLKAEALLGRGVGRFLRSSWLLI